MSVNTITNHEIAFQAAGKIANHTDTLNKSFKVSEQFFKLVSLISALFPVTAWMAAGTKLLADGFNNAKTITNSFNVLERFPDWGIAANREKILNRWQKAANRICLTVAQIFETVLFVDKCTLRFFYQTSLTIGKLPIVEGVKNFLYLGSAVFGLWCSGQDLSVALGKIEKAKNEQTKWNNFVFNDRNVKELTSKYTQKRNDLGIDGGQLNVEIQTLENSICNKDALLPTLSRSKRNKVRTEMKSELAKLKAKKTQLVAFNKYTGFLGAIEKTDYVSIKSYKIEKNEVRERNNSSLRDKSKLGLIVEIGKIVMITLGSLIAATCLIYPVLTTTTAAIIVTSLSMSSNALGLTKNIYGFLGPKQEQEPIYCIQEQLV